MFLIKRDINKDKIEKSSISSATTEKLSVK